MKNALVLATMTMGLALGAAACGDSGGAPADADGEVQEAELQGSEVALEIRDDGTVHALGLRGRDGEAWDHFVKGGDRIRLRNGSSKPVVADVTFWAHFTDGRVHHAAGRSGEIVHRELAAGGGSFAWTVQSDVRWYTIQAYADASEQKDLLIGIVSEPDGTAYTQYPVMIDVE